MRTIDKIRLAFSAVDVSDRDIAFGWYTFLAFIVTLLGLLAIGAK